MVRVSVLLVLSVCACVASANDAALGKSTARLCEKIKSCVVQDLRDQNLSPDQLQMMKPMLDNMCDKLAERVMAGASEDDITGPVDACLQSIMSLPCADLTGGEPMNTPECKAYGGSLAE